MDTITLQLTNQCRFHLGDEPNAWQAWYDDSTWQDVILPHDWSVTMPFSREYSSGTGYLAGGIGWYRLRITPQPEWQGKQISITFDGIYKNSRVWCNSYYLGERPNGYISFTYDLTKQFRFDADNIISVYVDRREVADSRWFTGSGITRKVTLTVEEAVHPVPNGIFFSTPTADTTMATYAVSNELINTSDDDCDITIINQLYDTEKNLVSEATQTVAIAAHHTTTIETTGHVDSPMLWAPESPYLYTLKTMIKNGSEYLADTQSVGIRTFTFDANKGFFLNGQPYLFKGVCVHHDAGCLGAAVYPEVWHRRLMKLKEMGCNAIRMSHNPHMPELYTLCDMLGFFVMDEAFDEWEGPKNKWSTGHNVYPPKHQGYYVDFPTWHEQDLVDMIRRDRNHPSVIMWSIGNEIDYPNDPYCHSSFTTMTGNNDANKPAAERMYNPSRPDATRLTYLSKHLCDIVKKTDTTHPVTLAAAFPELSAKLGFIDPLDVVGFNYKEHLYDEHHATFPDKPFLGSENGHGLKQWKAVTDNDYISGQFLWTGIDYLGEAHGWPIHGSGAGLLTLAGLEKTGYYRRQSFWSETPMLHLTTIREEEGNRTAWGHVCETAKECEFAPVNEYWNYIPGEQILIKCYTNLPEVEVFLNNESLGIFEKEADCDSILFPVAYQAGELTAIGTGKYRHVRHTLYTTGTACQMNIEAYRAPIAMDSPIAMQNITQLTVTLLDSDKHRVYHDNTMLHVTVENGTLLGLENGDLADVTDYSSTSRRAYRGQLVIYGMIASDAPAITVTVRGDGIKTQTVTVDRYGILS